MKEAVAGELAAAYHSKLVDEVRASDFRYDAGRLTLHLAREFGFCYGVDRAVDYAYQARARFPGRNVFLTGEIIHNPHVNDRLRDAGIRFLSDEADAPRALGPDDVVSAIFSTTCDQVWSCRRSPIARIAMKSITFAGRS